MNNFTLPRHNPNTRKGQNGKLLVVGGNEVFHGAPVLAGLGGKKSGVDLVSMVVPQDQKNVVRNHSLHFMVHTFEKNFLTPKDVPNILHLAQEQDALLIGNGMGKKPETRHSMLEILKNLEIPAVIDADGFFPEILKINRKSDWVLTPHDEEFERVFYCYASSGNIQQMTREYSVTILKKGRVDIIADSKGNFYENTTGAPQMTVGGTGDALAGLIAGFIAQGLNPFQAAKSAAYFWGKCGERMAEIWFSFSAREMLEILPEVMLEEEALEQP